MANDFCKEFAKTQKNAPVVLAVRLARRGTTVSLYNQFYQSILSETTTI